MEARAIRWQSGENTLVDQQHRLRARIFSGRLAWNVKVQAGRESDEYDHFDPTYIVALDDTHCVVGCARLLPATGPTMLERTFPQLLGSGTLDGHRGAIESSRFCVDTTLAEGRGGTLHRATLTMFAGIIEWSMISGYREIVTATDLRFERILNRAGWPMDRIGSPCRIGDTMAIAGRLSADQASFDRVCPPGYRSRIGELHVSASIEVAA